MCLLPTAGVQASSSTPLSSAATFPIEQFGGESLLSSLVFGARAQTQGLGHARQGLYMASFVLIKMPVGEHIWLGKDRQRAV